MDVSALHPRVRRALDRLADDLRGIFGAGLHALVVHGTHAHLHHARDTPPPHPAQTLALIERLEYRELAACAERADAWRAVGLAMPLLLPEAEFARSLDVFPLEYGDIIANHLVLVGRDPFEGMRILPDDLRRACEVQTKSHAIHLREGFLESGGDAALVSRLLMASAPPFATLLGTLARLSGTETSDPAELAHHLEGLIGVPASVAERVLALEQDAPITPDDAVRLFPPYLDLVHALAQFVDSWSVPATS